VSRWTAEEKKEGVKVRCVSETLHPIRIFGNEKSEENAWSREAVCRSEKGPNRYGGGGKPFLAEGRFRSSRTRRLYGELGKPGIFRR